MKNLSIQASLPSAEMILHRDDQVCWTGNIMRIEDIHMPKAVNFSKLQEGKCNWGAQRKHYYDQLNRQFAQKEINQLSWQQEASSVKDSWL